MACRQSIDGLHNVRDMIVASIVIIWIILPDPFRCWCFVRLVRNVNPANDFTRRYSSGILFMAHFESKSLYVLVFLLVSTAL